MSSENNDYRCVPPGTKILNFRRQSFISDFSDDVGLNRGHPREKYHLSSPGINPDVSRTTMNILHHSGGYSNISVGASRDSSLKYNTSGSSSPSYRSAGSMISVDGFLKTPEHKIFDLSRRRISPHWSVGKQVKSNTPSPFELSPGEMEYPDEYVPSPKRWPSPVSDTAWVSNKNDSLRIRVQKANFSDYMASSDRMFVTDDTGNTLIMGITESTQTKANNVQHVGCQAEDCISALSQKLERKLFASDLRDKLSADLRTISMSDHGAAQKPDNLLPAEFNKETSMTIGWNRKYKDLIAEMKLKGSIGKKEGEDQSKSENFRPVMVNDPHWMDSPRLEPLERPRLNKLQRWGLAHRTSRANLLDPSPEVVGPRSITPTPNEFQLLQGSSATLKQDCNFGNLEMSPGKGEVPSDSEDSDCCKHWEGFDDAYDISDPISPQQTGDEEDKWKLSMGKWAEKGVEVMKPVNEEGRDDGSMLSSPCSTRAVRWVYHGLHSSSYSILLTLYTKPSPISQSSDREYLLRDSPVSENDSADYPYHLGAEDTGPRTPSPLLPLLTSEKTDILEDSKKDNVPFEETSNRLFPRRMARASRNPITSPGVASPPRPLPVKLIRMFEDLSKPLPISPRSSSINYSPERGYSSPEKCEGSRVQEPKVSTPEVGNAIGAVSSKEMGKSLSSTPKASDDGLNECF
jgi:hypothetical protein